MSASSVKINLPSRDGLGKLCLRFEFTFLKVGIVLSGRAGFNEAQSSRPPKDFAFERVGVSPTTTDVLNFSGQLLLPSENVPGPTTAFDVAQSPLASNELVTVAGQIPTATGLPYAT